MAHVATAGGGVDFVRILGEVGGVSWEDRVIDPLDSDYEAQLGAAIDLAAKYGLRVVLSIFGGGVVDPRNQGEVDLTVEKVISVLRPRLDRVVAVEPSNEDNFPGSAEDLLRVMRRLREAFPSLVIVTPSNGPLDDSFAAFVRSDAANAMNLHEDRTVGDLGWRNARQLWGLSYPCPLFALEPGGMHLGQGEDVNDPVRLAVMRAVGLLSGFQAFVLHCGPGVGGGRAYDARYGRAANFYDLPDLADGITALRAIEQLLPADVVDWRKTSQHGREPFADNFLPADAIWSDEGEDHGVSRSFVAYFADGRFVALSFGIKGEAHLVPRVPVAGELHNLRTGDVVTVAATRDPIRLAGDPNADAAYVFIGRRA